MANSNFFDVKGNCSNEFGDHIDAQNHGLVNNRILDLHQSNDQSLAAINIDAEKGTPELPRSSRPSNRKLRERKADHIKDYEKNKKEINREFKRLKKANTFLENANASFKSQFASLKKSVKLYKKIAANWKGQYNEQINMVACLISTEVLNEIQLLQQRIVELEARNEQLENQISARDQVNEKETVTELPRSPRPSYKKMRNRMADTEKENINGELNHLKNANTSLENANIYFKNQCARLEKSVKFLKKNVEYWKGKLNGLTDVVTYFSTALLTEPNRNDLNLIQLLRQRIVQLEASNEQLENDINARD